MAPTLEIIVSPQTGALSLLIVILLSLLLTDCVVSPLSFKEPYVSHVHISYCISSTNRVLVSAFSRAAIFMSHIIMLPFKMNDHFSHV